MKSIKILFSLLAAVVIAVPAFAADVTFSGGTDARIGYSSSKTDVTGDKGTTKMGVPYNDASGKIIADVKDGKLEMKVGLQIKAGGPGMEEGWVSYSFDSMVMKFHGRGVCNRWSNDVLYFGDGWYSNANSLDFYAANMVFVTLINPYGALQSSKDDEKGTPNRTIPIIALGIDTAVSPTMNFKAGLVVDKPGSTKAVANTATTYHMDPATGLAALDDNSKAKTGGYTGYMAFVNGDATLGNIKVTFQANYAKDMGNLMKDWGVADSAGQNVKLDKSITAYGVRVPVDFTIDSVMSAGVDPRYSYIGIDSDTNSTALQAEVWFKYVIDKNLSFKPLLGYKVVNDKEAGVKVKTTDTWAFLQISYGF